MIAEGMMVVQSGHGTLQFPVEEVERIIALAPEVDLQARARRVKRTNVVAPGTDDLLIRAAIQVGLEPDFVRSVAMVESGLQQGALSPKGAVGLMQLMPTTAGKMGLDPNAADQNALGGAALLRQLLIRYNGDLVLSLAAYNAGPTAVDKYKGVPPYEETRKYVVKVLEEYSHQQRIQAEKNLQAAKMMGGNGTVTPTDSLPAQRVAASGNAAVAR